MSKSNAVSPKRSFSIRRVAIDAVLIALYYGLSLLAVEAGGLKFTFAMLPTILCALLYGPVDAVIVGLLGAFMEQMIKYGFTATTLLWILPSAVRGLIVGLGTVIFRKSMSLDHILKAKRPFIYYAVCIVSGLAVSILNTFVFYVDAKMFGYYAYEMIFGVFWLRLLSGVLSTVAMATVALPVVAALQRSHIVPVKWKAEKGRPA